MSNRTQEQFTSDNRFAVIPHWVIFSGVSSTAIHLYAVLRKYADGSSLEAFPARSTLAADMGKGTKTVDRALKELDSIGAVTVTTRKRKGSNECYSNLYTLTASNPNAQTPPSEIEVEGVASNLTPGSVMDDAENYTHPSTPTTSSLRSPLNSVQGTSLRSPSLSKRRTLHALAKDFATAATPDDREAASAAFAEQFENETGLDADFDLKGWSNTLKRDVRKHGLNYGVGKFLDTYTNTQKSA